MREKVLFGGFIAFLLGVAARSFFDIGVFDTVFVLCLSLILFFFFKKKQPVFLFVVMLAFGAGVARYTVALHVPELTPFIGEKVMISGIVAEEPDVRERAIRIVLEIESLEYAKEVTEISAREHVLLTTGRVEEYKYGDELTVEGMLEQPENFDGENGRTFNYIAYLEKDRIYYQMSFPKIEKTGEGAGNPIKATLFSLKNSFADKVSQVLPEPHASLLGGILYGAKQSLGTKLLDDFKHTGLIHIVVLSGYNIAIIMEWVMKLLSRFPKRAKLTMGVIFVIGFTVMTGAAASAVRAAGMALIILLARALEREGEAMRALMAMAFLMVLWNPKTLVFDPSFQLSFLATLGILKLSPWINDRLAAYHFPNPFREIASATLSTQVFVLPLLLYSMGIFSFVSLPANIAVLLAIPPAMFFGFFAGAFAFISPLLAAPIAFIAFGLLSYVLFMTEFFANLPGAFGSIPKFPVWLLVVVYGAYILFWLQKRKSASIGAS